MDVEARLVLVVTEVAVMAVKTAVRVAATSRAAKVLRARMLHLRSNVPLAPRVTATASVAAPAVAPASSFAPVR